MKHLKKISAFLLVASFLLVGSNDVFAQRGNRQHNCNSCDNKHEVKHQKHNNMCERMSTILDLNDVQKKKIENIFDGTKTRIAPIRKEMRTQITKKRQLKRIQNPDREAIAKVETKLVELRKRVGIIMDGQRAAISKVLTKEQNIKWKKVCTPKKRFHKNGKCCNKNMKKNRRQHKCNL